MSLKTKRRRMLRWRIDRLGREGKRSARELGLRQRRPQILVMTLGSDEPPRWEDARDAFRGVAHA